MSVTVNIMIDGCYVSNIREYVIRNQGMFGIMQACVLSSSIYSCFVKLYWDLLTLLCNIH